MTEKMFGQSSSRPTQDKIDMMVNGQMARMYDNASTVREKQKKLVQDLREDYMTLSPGGQKFVKANFISAGPTKSATLRNNKGN